MKEKPRLQTELDRRLGLFIKDRLVIIILLLGVIVRVLDDFIGIERHGGPWFRSTAVGVAFLLVNRMFRYGLPAFGFAALAMVAGLSVSLWYDLTGAARPPSDSYSLLGMLAGVFVGGCILIPISVRNKAERKRLTASEPIIEP
ncbi:MAG TPA: hypothetical protein VHE55_00290 [Fimbriimonadaceae bacterium]|nr:hypothetical protein [Fimbriimonadaceae bacterium]